MANKPSTKLLAFYIGTIAAVVGLFALVTAYGEQNLVAPASIAGRYRFKDKLPCLGDRVFTLQQSGAFLSAKLSGPAQNAQMSGAIQSNQLMALKANLLSCDRSGPLENVTLQGRLLPTKQLSGTLTYGASDTKSFTFEAIPLPKQKSSPGQTPAHQ